MKLRLLPLLTVSMLLTNACMVEETPKEMIGLLNAVIENDDTRTNVTDEGIFTWSQGDKVWIHTTAGYTFGTLYSGAGETTAKFEVGEYQGEMTGYAVYPHSDGHSISDDVLHVDLPEVYELGDDTDNTNAVLFASLSNEQYVFTHMAGIMRFEFKDAPAGTCQFKITLDKKINGIFDADMTKDYPVVESSEAQSEAERTITFNFDPLETVKDIRIYVPLPVGTYNSMDLELNDAYNTIWNYSKSVINTISRKSLLLMPAVQIPSEPSIRPMLDFKFNADGTASDVSPNNYNITTLSSDVLSTVYNTDFSCYMARFTHTAGTTMSNGYYEYDYSQNKDFQDKLADGFSMEAVIMLDFDMNEFINGISEEKELKPFATTESGGTGFVVGKQNYDSQLAFITNVSTTGESNWVWAKTGVIPERGKYYHIVGVYDKAKSEEKVYLNGELITTVPAEGNYIPANSNGKHRDCRAFIVGGDPYNNKNNKCQGAWPGSVVVARVYDEALTTEWVTNQWQNNIKDKMPSQTFALSDVLYLNSCNVLQGGKFNIMGSGFEASDVLRIISQDGNTSWDCTSVVEDDVLSATLPADITDGTYHLVVTRSGAKCEIGNVTFTVKTDADDIIVPKVIAHRGVHDNTTIPENSIAGLQAAIEMNVFGSELDVWITTDDVLVCNHNPQFNGYTLETSSYEDVKNLQLSSGEKLPVFDDVLTKMKNSQYTKLILEFKSHTDIKRSYRAVDVALEKIEQSGLSDDMVEYIAFSYDVCKYIKSQNQQAVVSYLNGDKTPELLNNDGINGLDYNQGVLKSNLDWVNQAHALEMTANVWTVNSDADFIYWIGEGVDFITTNKPARLQEIIGKLCAK